MLTRSPLIGVCLIVIFSAVTGGGYVSGAPTDIQVTPGEFIVDHPTLINLGLSG